MATPSSVLGARLKVSFDQNYAFPSGTATWVDDKANLGSLVQATGANQPASSSNPSQSKDLLFDGVNDVVKQTAGYATPAAQQFRLFFCYFKSTASTGANQRIWHEHDTGTAGDWQIHIADATGKVTVHALGTDALSNVSVKADGAYHTLIVQHDSSGGTVTLYIDGVAQTTTGTDGGDIAMLDGSGVGTGPWATTIGADVAGATLFFAGHIGGVSYAWDAATFATDIAALHAAIVATYLTPPLPSVGGVRNRLLRPLRAFVDGQREKIRFSQFQEVILAPLGRKQQSLAEELAYFTANNSQTGLATAAAPTAFSATNPFVLLFNTASPSDPNAARIFLDYVTLNVSAAGTAGASVQCAVTIDNIARYSSGGSDLSANIVGIGSSGALRTSVARVYAGNITAIAASANARVVTGNRYWKKALPVIGDDYVMGFGGVEQVSRIQISTVMKSVVSVAPVIIGPGQSALIHLWLPTQSAASSYRPEVSWWER